MAFLENTQVQEQFEVPTPQVDDPPKKKKLWDYMTKKQLYTKSYEDFDTQFSTPERVGKLYNFLVEKKQYTKSQDDFTAQFFADDVKKKEPTQPQQQIQQPIQETKVTETITPNSTKVSETSTSGAATQVPTSIPSPLKEKAVVKVEEPTSKDLLDASIGMINVDLIKSAESDDYVELVKNINLPAETKDIVMPNLKGGINILSGKTGEKSELNLTPQQSADIDIQKKEETEKLKTAKTWSELYGKEVVNGALIKVDDNFKTGGSRDWYRKLKKDNPNWDEEYLEMRDNGEGKIIPLPYNKQESLIEQPFSNVGDVGEVIVSTTKTKDEDVLDWYKTQLGSQAINLDTRSNTPEREALERTETFRKFNTFDRLNFALKEMPEAMVQIGKRLKNDQELWNNFKTEIDNLDEKDVASEWGVNEAFKKAVEKTINENEVSPETLVADLAVSKLKSLQVAYNKQQGNLTAKIKLAGENYLDKNGYGDELAAIKEFEQKLFTNSNQVTPEEKQIYEANKKELSEAIANSGIEELKNIWQEYATNKNIFVTALATAKNFLSQYRNSDKVDEMKLLQRQKERYRLMNQADSFFPSVKETMNKQEELAQKGGDPLYKSIPKSFYGALLQGVDDAVMYFIPEGKSKANVASMLTNQGRPSMMASLQTVQTDNPFYNTLNGVSSILGGVAPSMLLGRFGAVAELTPFFAAAAETAKTEAKKQGIKGADAELYGLIYGTIAAGSMAIKLPSSYMSGRLARDNFYAIVEAASKGDSKTVASYILKQLTPTAAGAKHIAQAELQVLATELGNNITNTIYNNEFGSELHTGINAEQFVNMAAFSWLMGRIGKDSDIRAKGTKEMILKRYEESPKEVIDVLEMQGATNPNIKTIKDLLTSFDKIKGDLPKDTTPNQKVAAATILNDIQGLKEKSAATQNAEIKQAIDKNISQKQSELSKILADESLAEKYVNDATTPLVKEMEEDIKVQKEEAKKLISVQMPSEVAKQREGEVITTQPTEYTPETKKSGVSIILPKPTEGEVITTKPITEKVTESVEQVAPKEESRTVAEPTKVSETESKKADIEKRRQEELMDVSKEMETMSEEQQRETSGDRITKRVAINDKYDAELAALEKSTTETVKVEQPTVKENAALRDVESTAKALEENNKYQQLLKDIEPLRNWRKTNVDPATLQPLINKLKPIIENDATIMAALGKDFPLSSGLSGARGELYEVLDFLAKEEKQKSESLLSKEQPTSTTQSESNPALRDVESNNEQVYYHGTAANFEQFEPNKTKSGAISINGAIFFSSNKNVAKAFADQAVQSGLSGEVFRVARENSINLNDFVKNENYKQSGDLSPKAQKALSDLLKQYGIDKKIITVNELGAEYLRMRNKGEGTVKEITIKPNAKIKIITGIKDWRGILQKYQGTSSGELKDKYKKYDVLIFKDIKDYPMMYNADKLGANDNIVVLNKDVIVNKPKSESLLSKEQTIVSETPTEQTPIVEQANIKNELKNSEGEVLPQNDITLQDGKAKQASGFSQIKGNSEKVQYNGTDAIGQRSRTESEKAASRKAAKEKVKTPEANAALQAANDYNKSVGLPSIEPHEFKPSDKVVQPRIGETYQELQDVTSPTYKETELERRIFDSYKSKYPELIEKYGIKNYKDLVEKSYAELIKEADAQFQALPIKVEFHEGDKNYENSAEMMDDVHNFGHLWVFKGGDDHTLLGSKTMDKNGLTANDKFRAVHDYFGHSIEGYQFGKDGEENAWIEHSKMFSPLAQIALSSETRGQNSFVNYSGINEIPLEKIKLASALNKKGVAENNQQMIDEAKKLLEEANNEFQFAEQKAIALPEEYTNAKKFFGKSTTKTEPTVQETKTTVEEAKPIEVDKETDLIIEPPKGGDKETQSEEAPELRNKAILERVANSKNINEATKEKLKDNLKYKVSSKEEAKSVAQEVIKEYGHKDAVTLAEAGKFNGDVNSFIFSEAIDNAFNKEQSAKTPEEKVAAAEEWADLAMRYDETARDKGRFISAIYDFYKKSPLGIQMVEKAKRSEEFAKWFKNKEKSFKEVYEEIIKEPEFQTIIKEEVQKELKKERVEARKAKREKIEDFFDKAKFKGDATYSTIIPAPVVNGALEIMKQTFLAGESVVNAVDVAVRHISEKIGDNWDKEKFKNEYEKKLSAFESTKGNKTKEELTIEKKERLLEKFRDKLKGLSEKDKDEVIRKSFKKLVESGALEYNDFKKIIADTVGLGEFTPQQVSKITELVNDINKVSELGEKARETKKLEDLKNYQDAKKQAEKAATQLGELVYNQPNVWNRVLGIMQLNTLGIPSLVNNPIFNIWNQLTVRLPIGIQLTALDQVLYGASKVTNKLFGTGVLLPENNIITGQKEFWNKLGLGTKESAEQLLNGMTNADYFQKEVKSSQIHPVTSLKDLWKFAMGEKRLTKAQIIDKVLQGTVGIPAEIVARVLNIGDKPQRFAAEGSQAAVFAKNLGLKGIDYLLFMEFPKEEAYRAYKQKGFSDEVAMKKAEEIKERIIKQGEESVFQQDNLLNDAINKVFEPFGKAGEVFKKFNMPFVKIPLNAFWSVYNLVNPELAILQSAVYGYRYAKTKSPLDLQQSKKWLAHATTGMALMGIAGGLAKMNIINADNDDSTTKKERQGETAFEQQKSINITKLNALLQGKDPDKVENGLNIDLKWLGNVGNVLNAQASKIENMTPEQRKNGLSYWEDIKANATASTTDFIDNGIFSNSGALLTAATKGGQFMDSYLINLMNMGTNIIQPAMTAQISRARLPYYSKVKADSFYDEVKNNFLTRSDLLRALTDKYPPAKIGLWGDVMEKKDNTMMRLFGISSSTKDNFAQPIYEDYKRTKNTKFFPPSVMPRINNEKLTVAEAEKLEILVGKARKNLILPFINDGAILDGYGKRYSELDDDEKTDALEIIYNQGFENGKAEFISLYPKYAKQQKSEKKTEQQSMSRSFRASVKDTENEY